MLKQNNINANRLTEFNVQKYVEDKYNSTAIQIIDKHMSNFVPLLQKDYGGKNDCTLTCMTAIINYITNGKYQVASIYDNVEKIAKKYFYHGSIGTSYFAIRTIFNKSIKKYSSKKAQVGYLKNVGYNQDVIMSQIDKNNPMVLTMLSDGLGYYKKHSVVIVGYRIYSVNREKKVLLKIYDNWYKRLAYLDYEKISSVSVLHYLAN